MRILDRYSARQLIPVWIWCLTVFTFLSCLIDLFEHLDEILRYHIPAATVLEYYLNFVPFVFVKASPIALLLATAFVATRLARYQEFLAMNASGTSLLRASVPFLFIGWLASLMIFFVNDRVVPKTSAAYERLRQEAFRGEEDSRIIKNVAVIDSQNRLYHARELDLKASELSDLTILEHDSRNQPTKSLYAKRAVSTKHGWLMLYGTIYRIGPKGSVEGEPRNFVDQLTKEFPVTAETFAQPESRPETMRFGQLKQLIHRLKATGIKDLRKYNTELVAKLTMPLMNMIICFIAFAGSTQPQLRGNLRGLGLSLGWGMLYYLAVAMGQGMSKEGFLFLPVIVAMLLPHAGAVWWCLRIINQAP